VLGTFRAGFLRLEKYGGDLCAMIEYKGVFKGREELRDAGGEIRTFGIDQVAYVSLRVRAQHQNKWTNHTGVGRQEKDGSR